MQYIKEQLRSCLSQMILTLSGRLIPEKTDHEFELERLSAIRTEIYEQLSQKYGARAAYVIMNRDLHHRMPEYKEELKQYPLIKSEADKIVNRILAEHGIKSLLDLYVRENKLAIQIRIDKASAFISVWDVRSGRKSPPSIGRKSPIING